MSEKVEPFACTKCGGRSFEVIGSIQIDTGDEEGMKEFHKCRCCGAVMFAKYRLVEWKEAARET